MDLFQKEKDDFGLTLMWDGCSKLRVTGPSEFAEMDDFCDEQEQRYDKGTNCLLKKSVDQSGRMRLIYSIDTYCIKDEYESPIAWIKALSEEWEGTDMRFALIYDNNHFRNFGIYECENGECINHFEESSTDILKRYKQEICSLIRNEFENMLFPKNILFRELHSEILSFTPYFGLNMDALCVLEETWKYINTEKMSGVQTKSCWEWKYGNIKSWYEKDDNFAYLLFAKLRTKLHQIRDLNEHISVRSFRMIEWRFFDGYIVSLIEDITGFTMKRRAKCKYYGSAAGCKNGDECDWSHNNPYSVPLCLYFNAFEGCTRGNKCYFRHSESDQEEPDNDCFFDVIPELETNENEVKPPPTYFCFGCKVIGDHWIMDCPQKTIS